MTDKEKSNIRRITNNRLRTGGGSRKSYKIEDSETSNYRVYGGLIYEDNRRLETEKCSTMGAWK